jgi:hypothetical protein
MDSIFGPVEKAAVKSNLVRVGLVRSACAFVRVCDFVDGEGPVKASRVQPGEGVHRTSAFC